VRFWVLAVSLLVACLSLVGLEFRSWIDVELPVVFRGEQARPTCPSATDADYFFESGALGRNHKFVSGWAASYLRAAHEPSLSCGESSADESYRFIWLRGHHETIIVRMEGSDKGHYVIATEFSRPVPYVPTISKAREVLKSVTREEWDSAVSALSASGFWTMGRSPDEPGFDGAEWVVEGRRGGAYHVVHRWSPIGPYREAALGILGVSRLSIDADHIH
jgi:hypothetical protein